MIEYAISIMGRFEVNVIIVKLKPIELNKAMAIFALWDKDMFCTTNQLSLAPRTEFLPHYKRMNNAKWETQLTNEYERPVHISIINKATLREMGRRVGIEI